MTSSCPHLSPFITASSLSLVCKSDKSPERFESTRALIRLTSIILCKKKNLFLTHKQDALHQMGFRLFAILILFFFLKRPLTKATHSRLHQLISFLRANFRRVLFRKFCRKVFFFGAEVKRITRA